MFVLPPRLLNEVLVNFVLGELYTVRCWADLIVANWSNISINIYSIAKLSY